MSAPSLCLLSAVRRGVLSGLVLLAALPSPPAFALPASPVPRPVLELPPWPGSAFEQRLEAHRAESRLPGHHPRFTASTPLAHTAANYSKLPKGPWQIVHQDVTVETQPAKPRLRVEVAVKVRPSGGETIAKLVFYTDLVDPKSIVVTGEEGQKLPAKYTVMGGFAGRLVVPLPAPLTEAVDTTIHVDYEAPLECSSKKTMLKSCSFDGEFESVMFFRYFLRHGLVSRAPFKSALHVLTDAAHVAAAPGVPLPPQTLGDGRLRWTFLQPERTSNAGFTIAKYDPVGDPVPESPTAKAPYVRVYTIGSFVKNAPAFVKAAKKMLSFFGERFIPFPWVGVNIIQNAQNLGGGYSPLSGVFMLRSIFGAKPKTGYWTMAAELLAHELAHQWWGNLARPLKSGDVSLSESLAEFSSCLYTEKVLGSRRQIVQDNLNYMYTVPHQLDVPLGSNYVVGAQAYVPIVYHKGAVVMDMLRIELGDAVMLKGLAHYAQAFDRDYAEISDLQASMEAVSGRDLGWYFKQWFKGKGAIHVQLTGRVEEVEAGGWRFRLRVATLGYVEMRFRLPLRITYTDGTTGEVFVDVLPKGGAPTVVEVLLDKRPRGIRPDMGRRLLRAFEVLTPGDVNLDGLTDGEDFLEAAFRKGRAIRAKNHQGQSFLFPNQGWDELFDVARDEGMIVDESDLDFIADNLGAEAIDF